MFSFAPMRQIRIASDEANQCPSGYRELASTVYHRKMSAIGSDGSDQIRHSVPIPGFLVELPSRHRVFFGNLRDLLLPRRLPQLDVEPAPAPFWPDVFVKRGLPWAGFLESGFCHFAGLILVVAMARFLALHPQPVPPPVIDRPQVIYYSAAEYLPPLDTRVEFPARRAKADPEISRQPIISVPPEADNPSQTIVAPPNVKLKRDLALPNIVAWSQKMEKPQLEIPAAPTLAAEITRTAPRMKDSVVNPPPDAARLMNAREQLSLQTSVVAPPPDLHTSRSASAFEAPQPAVVAPPPLVGNAPVRTLGEVNIGQSSVIAPAPQLPVGEQRAVPGGRSSSTLRAAPQVVPPPPSYSAAGSVGVGSADRVIVLNLRPAIGAPPDPPRANRRGSFAATPEGHPGALGTPGSSSAEAVASVGTPGGKDGSGLNRKAVDALPSGLYVGSAPAPKNSSAAADPGATTTVARAAGLSSPRVNSVPARPMQPEATSKISEAERAVFGTRRLVVSYHCVAPNNSANDQT